MKEFTPYREDRLAFVGAADAPDGCSSGPRDEDPVHLGLKYASSRLALGPRHLFPLVEEPPLEADKHHSTSRLRRLPFGLCREFVERQAEHVAILT